MTATAAPIEVSVLSLLNEIFHFQARGRHMKAHVTTFQEKSLLATSP